SIWDSSTGGTKLWPTGDPTPVTLLVRQGVFNVNIGDATYPDPLNYNFNTNKNIYLQVSVYNGADYEDLTPRQQVSSAVFAQISGAVSGTGQSSFGTTTPISNSVVTIEATSTSAIPVSIRAFTGQLANLFRIEDSSLNPLFSVNSLGGVFASSTLNVTGATNLYSKLKVVDTDTVAAQLRVSQSDINRSEFLVDATGDLHISSNGGNVLQEDQNLWVCVGGSGCSVNTDTMVGPDHLIVGKGNIIADTSLIFGNKFKFKLKDNGGGATTTTVMLDSSGSEILEFDEGR
ncbi:MAG: hypothetical protein NTX96_02220, partial [Candidatus Zambryskibacteria bacterium]|nr:hypothetical protein [Candidatus Zambryskibacteria bacterium]